MKTLNVQIHAGQSIRLECGAIKLPGVQFNQAAWRAVQFNQSAWRAVDPVNQSINQSINAHRSWSGLVLRTGPGVAL